MAKRKGFLPMAALGQRISIRFDDHSIYNKAETICEVAGIVDRLTDTEIVVRWWTVFAPGTTIAEIAEDNHEFCRIVQGTVRQWAFTEPKKWNEV